MQKVNPEDFAISVKYSNRTYHYKVVRQRISHKKEVFKVLSNHKTVIVESNWRMLCRQGLKIARRKYTYNKVEITNKGLMSKIIELIDKHIGTAVSETKQARAIAV